MPINLGSGAISGAYVGADAVTAAYVGGTSVFAAGGGGITPNNDNKARFYLPAATTQFQAGALTTTGYWRLSDGTSTSTVVYNPGALSGTPPYNTNQTTMTNLGSAAKVIELYSCDASGNPSGDIVGIEIHRQTQAIDAIDISGCTELDTLGAWASSEYGGPIYKYSPGNQHNNSLPSSITEIRAVGVTLGYSATALADYGSVKYYYWGGIDISGHQLDDAALDQFYSDLGTTSGTGKQLIVRNNPGTSSDTPSIATSKGYTVYGS